MRTSLSKEFETWMEAQATSAEDSKRREELQLHREKVGSVKRPAMWRELLNYVVLHLSIYESSQRLTGLQLFWEVSADGNVLDIRRTSFPCLVLRVSFLEARMIRAEFRYRKNDEAEIVEWDETLAFRSDDEDRVQFTYKGEPLADYIAAGNIILRPIVEPMYKPTPTI